MADNFKFPDGIENAKPTNKTEAVDAPEIEIEIIDDAPPEDQKRLPLPKKQVEELEADDLEAYDGKVKYRLSQMKKVWHDERREKETAIREREEAFNYAQAKDREIRQLRNQVGHGEQMFVTEVTKSATSEIAVAREHLKKAYEAGDSDLIADAQEELTDAKLRMRDIQALKPTLQIENNDVQQAQQPRAQAPVVDSKAESWRTKNTWFGVDKKMTGFALGLHQELVESGIDPRSDDYYEKVNTEVKQAFPDRFEEEDSGHTDVQDKSPQRTKASSVVAPVSRTTAPRRIRLTASQSVLVKRLGLTPEAYVREMMKSENNNG
jgi:hypothetical protein